MDQIVAFAEQRLSQGNCGGIGEAIAKIQRCPMSPFPKRADCESRELCLLRVDRNEFDSKLAIN